MLDPQDLARSDGVAPGKGEGGRPVDQQAAHRDENHHHNRVCQHGAEVGAAVGRGVILAGRRYRNEAAKRLHVPVDVGFRFQ